MGQDKCVSVCSQSPPPPGLFSALLHAPSRPVLATETPAPRNPDLEVVKAPDERPPLPKIHRKVPEPVQPRQRSTRVRVIGSLPNRGFLKIDTC
jgi:hypothetical protein